MARIQSPFRSKRPSRHRDTGRRSHRCQVASARVCHAQVRQAASTSGTDSRPPEPRKGSDPFFNPFFQSPDPRRSDASTSGTDSPRPGGSPPRSSPTGALDRRRHLIGVEAVQDARLLTQEDLDASAATPKPTYRSTLVRRPVMIVCPSSAPGIIRTSSSIPRHMILLGQGFLFRGRNACAQTCVYDMMTGARGSDLGRRAP